jgi:hypothetical protein
MHSKKRKAAKPKATALEKRMDRLAVRIVSVVADSMTGEKLYAYGGIEAARAVRGILLRSFGTANK